MTHGRKPLPLRCRALAVAALALDSTAPVTGPVRAQPVTARPADDGDIRTPWLDYAGSQIAAHEGRGDQAGGAVRAAGHSAAAKPKPKGHDVASHQKSVNWARTRGKGARFVYVKATESTDYENPYFDQQYNGARAQGMLHGGYHFALPDRAAGDQQARHFVANGGAWQLDGWTLPPAVDLEYNPYGADCYGISKAGMRSWITAFNGEVNKLTGQYPVIYTTAGWWKRCTGNTAAFAGTSPLWIARHNSSPDTLPAGWEAWTFWQYDSSGTLPGDQDAFNGSFARLKKLANGRLSDHGTPKPPQVHLPFTRPPYGRHRH
jgi:GH25 family lysozyme M1 (1,4-beta-N-acetylmuramidase)